MTSPLRFLAVLALCISLPAHAQTAEALKIPTVAGEMSADGRLDEAFWQQAAVTELLYETDPGENLPASVRTKVYIVDSGTSFRVAFEAFDPDPEKIISTLRDRDKAYDDDTVGFQLDAFDTMQRALWFYVSARGVQMDGTYDESRDSDDDSWDAIWDSGAQLDEKGYTVEFDIPYSSLKFRHSTSPQQWNVKFQRFRPREQTFKYANVKRDRDNNCNLCQQAKISGFAHADPGRNIIVNPTLTFGYGESRADPDQNFSSDGTDVEFGLDLSWSPTPNNTLSATYNPDFSQIEIDGAQLDVNTTFALFFPEKRPFFLDSADYFNSPSQLVYTRNVADPDYGLRFTGRQGEQTYGLFAASDAQSNVLRPGPYGSRLGVIEGESTDFVGAYRYSLTETSHIGALVTQRSGDDYSNTLSSIDGKWEKGAHTLTGQWMHSDTDDVFGYQATPFTGDAYYAGYSYRDREKSFNVQQYRRDPGFRADMGFVGKVDFEQTVVGGAYRWYPKDSFFTEISVYGDWDITHQISVERMMEREIEAYISLEGKYQSYMEAGGGQRRRFWNGVDYDESYYIFFGKFKPISTWELSLFYRGGDQVDFRNNALGSIDSFEPGLQGSLNGNISINLSYIDERLQRDGGTVYHAKLLDTRLSWQFNLRQRLRLALQYGSTEFDQSLNSFPVPEEASDVGTQLVYSYKINPRSVFYAGYSDSYTGSDAIDTFQTDRSLFLKFGYAWQP